jgi:hypothetical protein
MISVLGILVVAHATIGFLILTKSIDMPSDSRIALCSVLFVIAALLLVIVLYLFFGQDTLSPSDSITIPRSLLFETE